MRPRWLALSCCWKLACLLQIAATPSCCCGSLIASICTTFPLPGGSPLLPLQVDVVHRGQVCFKGLVQPQTIMTLVPTILSARQFPDALPGVKLVAKSQGLQCSVKLPSGAIM